MMFLDSDVGLTGIFLLFAASVGLFALAIAQAIRAMKLPGWRKVLYPAQMILGFWVIIISAYAPWVIYPAVIGSLALTWLTRKEDPDLKWFATLSGLVTLGICVLSFWAV